MRIGVGYANRYERTSRYQDPREWFDKRPMFGSYGSWTVVMPDEFDVETLGPRVAGWIAGEIGSAMQEHSISEVWLR